MQTKRQKLARNNKFFLLVTALLLLATACPAWADVELTADYIKYNMGESNGNARGNVHLIRGADYINGDELYSDFKNGVHVMERNIAGFLAKQGLYFFGDHMRWNHTDDSDIINLWDNVRFEHKTTAKDYDHPSKTKLYTDIITCRDAVLDNQKENLVLNGPVFADLTSQRTKIYGDNVIWEQSGDERLNVNGHVRIERVTEKATAKGKKPLVTDVLTSNTAYYLTKNDFIQMNGNVKGDIPSQEATSSCNQLTWQKGTGKSQVEMNGAARINRFKGRETLKADRAKYIELGEGYELEKGVEIVTETRHINCDKFIKHGKYFKGFGVTRFEDTKQKYNARGDKVVGTMIKNKETGEDEVDATTVMGNVYFEFTNKENQKTVITGEEAVYTKDNNSATITGNPIATRSDGKKIMADQFRVDLATKIYYAEGNAHLVYIKENKEEPNQNDKKEEPKQETSAEQGKDEIKK